MSRIYLRSNTLILWLSLSAALAASALGAGCSSSSDSGGEAGSGKSSGGATAKAGSSSSDAGDPAVGGETGEGGSDETPEPGAGGKAATGGGGKAATAGSTASGGSIAAGGAGSGEAGERGEVGAGGSPEVEEDPLVVAAQERALTLIKSLPANKTCTKCHDVKYQGNGFYPNITPDVATGIGSWNEEQIKTAIRDGKDKDQQTLCATMERYPFNDDQLSDIAIFLKHLPPVNKKITAKCPGSP